MYLWLSMVELNISPGPSYLKAVSTFLSLDSANCSAVMSTNMVAFLLMNNHRKVTCCKL